VSQHLCRIVVCSTIVLVVGVVVTALGTRYDVVDKMTGFDLLVIFTVVAGLLAVLAMIALIVTFVTARSALTTIRTTGVLTALAVLGGYAVLGDRWMAPMGDYPMIHDVFISRDASDATGILEHTLVRVVAAEEALRKVERRGTQGRGAPVSRQGLAGGSRSAGCADGGGAGAGSRG
jgi:hypothetical protein